MNKVALVLLGMIAVAGCDPKVDEDRVAAILALEGDSALGAAVYDSSCASCHGADGEGVSGPSLLDSTDETEVIQTVLDGKGDMPAYDSLGDQDIADLAAHVVMLSTMTM